MGAHPTPYATHHPPEDRPSPPSRPQVLRCAAVCPFPGTRTPRLFTNTRPPTNHPVGALPRGRPPNALPSPAPRLTGPDCYPGTRAGRLLANTRPPTNHPVGALPRGRPPNALPSPAPRLTGADRYPGGPRQSHIPLRRAHAAKYGTRRFSVPIARR